MSKLTWTRERPTQAGWYWWRYADPAQRSGNEVVKIWMNRKLRVDFMNSYRFFVEDIGGEWAGPIPEPEEM